jgi:hypothetical protein
LLEGKSMHITMASTHKPKSHDAPDRKHAVDEVPADALAIPAEAPTGAEVAAVETTTEAPAEAKPAARAAVPAEPKPAAPAPAKDGPTKTRTAAEPAAAATAAAAAAPAATRKEAQPAPEPVRSGE